MSTPKHPTENRAWTELDEERLERAMWIGVGLKPISAGFVLMSWAYGCRRFSHIQRHTKMSSSTVSRALKVLIAKGLVSKDADGRYETGPLFWSYRCPRRGTKEECDKRYRDLEAREFGPSGSQNISSAN